MKFKLLPNILSIIAGIMLSVSIPAFAVKDDARKDDASQPIHIDSEQQSLDMRGNTLTFTGNVVVTQGSIKISADKVVVLRPNGEPGKEIIEGYGQPVTFTQMQDDGKPVMGQSQKLRYELDKDFIVLSGSALLKQLDSNVQGDKITYLVKEQKMEAISDKGKRVTTVLLPAQLQEHRPSSPEKSP